MSIEILVNVAPRETRAALLDNGALQEVYIERASRRGLVSNLYKGRVSRVLPGMQAAFIDVGLARTGFLHASDIVAPPGLEGSFSGVMGLPLFEAGRLLAAAGVVTWQGHA